MKNKSGYIIGIVSTIIYTFLNEGNPLRGIENSIWVLFNFLASMVGAMLFPAIISLIIWVILKKKNFGKIFGITCVVMYILSLLGNNLY